MREIRISVTLPFVGFEALWVPNDAERAAAWELLVELVTRTSVTPLEFDDGILREALTSVYSLFGVTREVLKRHGPEVARDHDNGNPSLATIAAVVLNSALRPVLSKWHPLLLDHEEARPAGKGKAQWEREWPQNAELRKALDDMRQTVRNYVDVLGQAAGTREFADAVLPRRRAE